MHVAHQDRRATPTFQSFDHNGCFYSWCLLHLSRLFSPARTRASGRLIYEHHHRGLRWWAHPCARRRLLKTMTCKPGLFAEHPGLLTLPEEAGDRRPTAIRWALSLSAERAANLVLRATGKRRRRKWRLKMFPRIFLRGAESPGEAFAMLGRCGVPLMRETL